MKNVTKVRIEFENCEDVTIPIECFGDFYIGSIETRAYRIASNSICQYPIAHEVYFELFSEANTMSDYPENFWDTKYNVLERIQVFDDITRLVLSFDDDSLDETYVVDYDDESPALGARNLNQKTYLSDLGNLYVVIQKGKDIKDYFTDFVINDEESIAFKKRIIMNNDA